MDVFNLQDIPYKQLASKNEEFSLSAVLSDIVSFKKVFVHHEILNPGKRSSSVHAHTKKEEMALVLSGYPVAQLEDENRKLKPGDFIGFKPGEKHVIKNTSSKEVSLLVICSNDADDEVLYEQSPICTTHQEVSWRRDKKKARPCRSRQEPRRLRTRREAKKG